MKNSLERYLRYPESGYMQNKQKKTCQVGSMTMIFGYYSDINKSCYKMYFSNHKSLSMSEIF